MVVRDQFFYGENFLKQNPVPPRNDPDIACFFLWKNTIQTNTGKTKPIGHAVHQAKMWFAGHRFTFNYGSGIMWISPRFPTWDGDGDGNRWVVGPFGMVFWDGFFLDLGDEHQRGLAVFFSWVNLVAILFWSRWKCCVSWSNKWKKGEFRTRLS